ncbi:hypothetical protein [Nocardioides dongkuii]|uniref:hypothetical protein n=1 Tax=Nocardioides dongkuii TaxID=2760089 RepID=UPI0015F896AD|nr:hypothetical protein [Nocardioides dongkuii]
MTTGEDINARRNEAFAATCEIVRDWRNSGRRTTTAGLTSTLKIDGILDIESLGMATNREFWEQATALGFLSVQQQSNGHRFVLLPGEQLSDFEEVHAAQHPRTVAPLDAELRLKSDVWTSFVDWNLSFRRFWDRSHDRAFMVPAIPGWTPEVVDASRFSEIAPALQDMQIDWMKSFAERQPDPDRTALRVSLSENAPRGAFRRELRERGLNRAWREALRAHILDVAIAWADEANIEVSSIMETRHRDTDPVTRSEAPTRSPAGSAPVQVRTARQGAATVTGCDGTGETSGLTRTEMLRAKLHRAIDQMTWDELAQIPVRAEHLLDS